MTRLAQVVTAVVLVMFLICLGAFLHALSIAKGAHPPIDDFVRRLVNPTEKNEMRQS